MSTVHRGTAFEERSLALLRDQFSMTLTRVGGRDDGGIDLIGWWWLPSIKGSSGSEATALQTATGEQRRRIRVVAQCKAEKKKMGPNYVRELEGVVYRLRHGDTNLFSVDPKVQAEGAETLPVALLISQSPFTKSTILRAHSSPIPFFLLHLPPEAPSSPSSQEPASGVTSPTKDETIGAAVWNPALAGSSGLLQGQMEVRWERNSTTGSSQPRLWWQGNTLKNWTPAGPTVSNT
ncbi:hypothetical protein CC1G_12357 [Coprinopsis cinerea okayama7|uniref:Restriction endonuclease type IV Mrr domain-containing protein n=1 Tax=Coprinopsis cinerea (strain Okayama-7 / 130 / ATCC MYA-4618 / FGSC 9003) TaxID=240176 RepID=A8P560_COPC7|nr:hypothetical protein CC1G_12357 [Coprinopsis cinerea okayama7\|eukprot:XP_001838883.1 hypothetical protein CC1G_12357 [Coprinopsis cinerea okayama7\